MWGRSLLGLLIVVLLLSGSAAHSQRSQQNGQETQSTQQPTATDQRGTDQSPLVVNVLPPEAAEDKAKHEAADRAPKDKLDRNPVRLAIASIVVAFLQFVAIGIQAVFLWFAFQAAKSAVNETRRIGEAQVRAYVSIKSAGIGYSGKEQLPFVHFVARNTGQSPARNFLWDVTIQYTAGGQKQTSMFNPDWLSGVGLDIAATDEITSQMVVILRPLKVFRDNWGGNLITIPVRNVFVRIRIGFRFTDVFDHDWFGESYFHTVGPPPVGPEAPIGVPKEMRRLNPAPKPI